MIKQFIRKYKSIYIVVLFVILSIQSFAQSIKLCSWNIQNMGKSKDLTEIEFIANSIKDMDIVAIQEVVAGQGGAKSIALLADELNRTGTKWDYVISNPTKSDSHSSERYAFLWKTSKIKLNGKPELDQFFQNEIVREPYIATFEYNGKIFSIFSFHAVPKNKQPEAEIKYFKKYPELYPNKNLIFCGDFNTPQSNTVFNPLKQMGYKPAFKNQKTTITQKETADPKGDPRECLASEYDNFFFDTTKINKINSGIFYFFKHFNTMKDAAKISDHLPIFIEIELN